MSAALTMERFAVASPRVIARIAGVFYLLKGAQGNGKVTCPRPPSGLTAPRPVDGGEPWPGGAVSRASTSRL